MTKSTKGNLLYRASRDGFYSRDFHDKCDGKSNTITIIKNSLNYVFGGFASSAWSSSYQYINDTNAFLFSLRRNGTSTSDKFLSKISQYSLFCRADYGPTFGAGHDIHICNQSNTNYGSQGNLGHSFNLPNGYTYGGNAKDFLTGSYNQWTTTEIEVYEIIL